MDKFDSREISEDINNFLKNMSENTEDHNVLVNMGSCFHELNQIFSSSFFITPVSPDGEFSQFKKSY